MPIKQNVMKTFGICLLISISIFCSCTHDENPTESQEMLTSDTALNVQSNNVAINYKDEGNFVSALSSHGFMSPNQIPLNRTASTNNYEQVYGFNIPAANQVPGFKWNPGDEQTGDWRPQGITGFHWGGRRFLLASWYGVGAPANNQHKGVRISLLDITDMNDIGYRH